MVEEKAYAKVNLSLDVIKRRKDGYHAVKMIMQTIDLYDTLTFEKTEKEIKLVTDNYFLNKEAESGKDNLVVKAAKAFFEYTGINGGVEINLYKRIPLAAGMGGGSSDAAAALRALNSLYCAGLSADKLREIGVTIGADVPFCVEGGTCLCEGIGEVLTKLPDLPLTDILICKPRIDVSTKAAYEAYDSLENPFHPDVAAMKELIVSCEVEKQALAALMGNSLEKVTSGLYPEIESIKGKMLQAGALNAMMSGSGPTVFGVFGSKEACVNAGKSIMAKCPLYVTRVTSSINPKE